MRRPVFHFLVIGMLLFVGSRLLASSEPAAVDRTIEIDSQLVAELRNQWARRAGSTPSPAVMDGILRQEVDDEILFREASAAGLMEADSVVQRRLILNAQFLGLDDASEAELLDQARALDLHLTDPVVRRRLVQLMRSAIFAAARAQPVADEELQLRARYERDAAQFMVAPRVRLTHVFVGRQADGSHEQRAKQIFRRLRSIVVAERDAIALGDPFLRGHALSLLSERELEGYFGPRFAADVFELPAQEWSQPIESAYGWHVVRVAEHVPERQPAFEEVRDRVRNDWMREREQMRLREVLDELREDYVVSIARPEAGGER